MSSAPDLRMVRRRQRRSAALRLGTAVTATWAVLVAEAWYAAHRIGEFRTHPPKGDGLYAGVDDDVTWTPVEPGTADIGRDDRPVVVAMIGDSSAAGYGMEHAEQTPGALIAAGLAQLAPRPVRLIDTALSGATSVDLDRQVTRALHASPDVAVILIGVNDVVARMSPHRSAALLARATDRLRRAGCQVVVGTCPNMGVVRPIVPPLAWVARWMCRRLAAAQTVAVIENGGRTVSLGSLLAGAFDAHDVMWGPDQFHPSESGYVAAAAALLPSVAAAIEVDLDDDATTRVLRAGESTPLVMPIAHAASEAARRPGTELTGTRVGGRDRTAAGLRWVHLRSRTPLRLPRPRVPGSWARHLPHRGHRRGGVAEAKENHENHENRSGVSDARSR